MATDDKVPNEGEILYDIRFYVIVLGGEPGTVRYDLQSIVVICLGKNSWEGKATALHGLLGTLFSDRLTPEQKEDILSKEYRIKMEIEIKEGMNQMCNLSNAIGERGITQNQEPCPSFLQKNVQDIGSFVIHGLKLFEPI